MTWFFLVLSSTCGIGIVVYDMHGKVPSGRAWKWGLFILVLSNLVILSMPAIRGYYLYNASGDSGYHLATSLDLRSSGHLDPQNFYPITAIQLVATSLLPDVDLINVFRALPPVYHVLYMAFFYYFIRSFVSDKRMAIIATLACLVFINAFGIILAPNQLANFGLPLAMFLVLKGTLVRGTSRTVTILIVFLLFAPFHPLPASVLLLFVISTWLMRNELHWRTPNGQRVTSDSRNTTHLKALLLGILIIAWISSFLAWDSTLRNIATLAKEGGPTYLESVQDEMKYATSHGYSILAYFLQMYGATAVYALAAIAFLLFLSFKAPANFPRGRIRILLLMIIVLSAATGVFYLANLPFGPTRMLTYVSYMAFIPIGLLVGRILARDGRLRYARVRIIPIAATVFFLAVYISGILALFPSPYSLSVSYQYTASDAEGMNWFVHNKDTSLQTSGWYYNPWFEGAFLLSHEERISRTDLTRQMTIPIPNHFGYDKFPHIGQSYGNDTYTVVKELNRRVYVDVYPQMAEFRLLPSDFNQLESDTSIDRICTNGGFEVYLIHAEQK